MIVIGIGLLIAGGAIDLFNVYLATRSFVVRTPSGIPVLGFVLVSAGFWILDFLKVLDGWYFGVRYFVAHIFFCYILYGIAHLFRNRNGWPDRTISKGDE